mgnify:CR=1 FL=1
MKPCNGDWAAAYAGRSVRANNAKRNTPDILPRRTAGSSKIQEYRPLNGNHGAAMVHGVSAPVPSAPGRPRRVALFVTCLVDLYRPNVGFAAIKLLEEAGCLVEVPPSQTCCGQPAYNGGGKKDAAALAKNVIEAFEPFDYLVAPSGSCAGMIKVHYPRLFADDPSWLARAESLAGLTGVALGDVLSVSEVIGGPGPIYEGARIALANAIAAVFVIAFFAAALALTSVFFTPKMELKEKASEEQPALVALGLADGIGALENPIIDEPADTAVIA